MSTRKPLEQMIPELLQHIKVYQQQQTMFEKKVLDIFEGALQKYVEESIQQEMLAGSRIIQRVAPINVLPKIMEKSSKVYKNGVVRDCGDNEIDNMLLSNYEKSLNINTKLHTVNKLINLFRYCALEPYIDNGKQQLRILPPTQFTVYSDSSKNPLNPTVFIKYMGKVDSTSPRTDSDGKLNRQAENVVTDVDLFYLYSNDEFLIVDSEGVVRRELMNAVGNVEGINPLGTIPFIYISTSEFDLIPIPRQDMLTMPILIPKLITDLNYAVKYMSNSIIYSIDLDAASVEKNPDTMWNLKSDGDEGKTGSLGTIKPEVDVDKVLNLVKSELDLWFDTLSIKSDSTDSIDAGNAISGISKVIDNIDASELASIQRPMFLEVEQRLWSLIAKMHVMWVTNNQIAETKSFSDEFEPTISFGVEKILPNPKEEVELAKQKLDAGFTSYRRAVAKANPELSPEEINDLIEEITQEKQVDRDKVMTSFNNATEESELEDDDQE